MSPPCPQNRSAVSARVRVTVSSSEMGTHSSGRWALRTSPGPNITVGVCPTFTSSLHVRPIGLKVASRREDVDVGAAALLAVEHRRPCVAVGFEPGPGRFLEGVQNLADLFVGRLVVRCPRDHAGGVPVLEPQSVRHRRHPVRIAPKDLDAFARLPGGVPVAEEVFGRSSRRSGSARQELNVHPHPGFGWGPRR